MTPARSEEGSSLIEILVAISILGVVVTGVLGALATGLDLSAVDRTHAKAEAVLRSYAEAVQAATFDDCVGGVSYDPDVIGFADVADDGVTVVGPVEIQHWIEPTTVTGVVTAAFGSCADLALGSVGDPVDLAQRITLRVEAADARVGILDMDIVKFVGATS